MKSERMSMEPSIKNDIKKPIERQRRSDRTGRLKRDSLRWQRKRATIEKYEDEKFGVSEMNIGMGLQVHNSKAVAD
jgi:hypothetical protein